MPQLTARPGVPGMDEYADRSSDELRQMVVDAFGPEFRAEADRVQKELLSESHRASALVGAAWLEDQLHKLIGSVLPDDESIQGAFNQPNMNQSRRIDLAFGLGIIGAVEMAELSTIQKTRNKFAHRTSVSFANTDVAQLTECLDRYLPTDYVTTADPADRPHSRYVMAVSFLVASLFLRIQYASQFNEISHRLAMLRFFAEQADKEDSV